MEHLAVVWLKRGTTIGVDVAQRTEKVAESVARQILQDIRRNRLGPGSMLPPESTMVERFGVGRGSVREALRILEVNGLVTLKPGPRGGPVVAPHAPGNFGQMMTLHLQLLGATYRQLLEARLEYEVVLARKAAEQPGEEAGRLVRESLAPSQDGTDEQRYVSATSGFHSAVGKASGNPVLALAADSIYAIWSVRVTEVLYPADERAQVITHHEAIARAIERHDAKRARRLMREHMLDYVEYCEKRYPARMDDIVDWK
jgi:GntR family transcriptional regulator, transcriptional repressor for pyruvate dehydrogenase complex